MRNADYLRNLPATDSPEEWKGYFDEAAAAWFFQTSYVYPLLPAPDTWPDLADHMRNVKYKSADDKNKAECLATLLTAPVENRNAVLKTGIKSMSQPYDYRWRELKAILIQNGAPPEEAEQFLVDTFKKPKEREPYKKKIDPWTKLINDGKIDEGIDLLLDNAANVEDNSKAMQYYTQALILGDVLSRPDLFEEVKNWGLSKIENFAKDKKWYSRRNSKRFIDILTRSPENWPQVYASLDRAKGEMEESKFKELEIYHLWMTLEHEGSEALFAAIPESFIFRDPKLWLDELANLPEFATQLAVALPDQEAGTTLLKYLIAARGGKDAYYRALIDRIGAEAEPFLKQLSLYNPYEERPLIWRAELAIAAGDLDTAKTLVDQAIALDPSDGEQGKDTRMQVYNVLAKILRAQGNEEKATFFEEVTKSIRLGERADDFLEAGLKNEAIRRYQEALGHFQDAYCLQSRLAKTLLDQGRADEAVVHFEQAFELMPVSFGPVESHCFGCEGIFDSPEAQAAAAKVFQRIIDESADNPRTYYLMGLLFQEQKKEHLAFEYFAKAFDRDRRYYNAAKQMEQYLQKHPDKAALHPDLSERLFEITPYKDYPNRLRGIYDLRAAWEKAQAIATTEIPLGDIGEFPQIIETTSTTEPEKPHHNYIRNDTKAVFGWERADLLRRNGLVSILDSF